MASTFFGLQIAGSGLRAANAAMNTTANNISNADTDGFSRQKVVQQAANAVRTFTTYGCSGAGVDTIAIERIRDSFYDIKYRENETSKGEYAEKLYYQELIQQYFNDNGKTGFDTIFTSLKTSLQDVLKNAGSATTKQAFINTGAKLAEFFNNLASNLENLQKDVNAEIKVKTNEINSISAEIASLNKQINVVELTGAKANELRDQRDVLIDKLSTIVDVETSESPIYDTNNPDRETGAHRFIVKIAGGQPLVDGNDYNTLACIARDSDNRVNQTDIVGLYDIYWVYGEDKNGDPVYGDVFSTTNARMGGELSGLLQLRDGNNNEGFKGKTTAVGDKTVTVEVTADYLTDLNKCNLAQSGTINVGNKLYNYIGWTYEKAADGTVSYTFELTDDISTARIGKEASVGSAVDYQGIPYYMQQMNEWLRLFSQAYNQVLESGYTDDGKQGVLMMTGTKIDGTQFTFQDGVRDADGNYTKISTTDDSYYRLTASNFSINKQLLNDGDMLATKKAESATDGESQYDNMTELLSMMTDKKKMSYRGSDAGEFLTCLLGDVSLNANSAETFTDTYKTMSNTLDRQRLSISGVDTDDEALSLVQYQNTYTLASKMISTFTEIYDRLILETGV